MATKATPGTVEFNGKTYTVSTSFEYASFYLKVGGDDRPLIKFHRSLQSAQKGTWDSPQMRQVFVYAGWAEVKR